MLLEVSVKQINGQIDMATDTMFINNGVRANARDLVVRDSIEGIMVWEIPPMGCDRRKVELYHGQGVVKRRRHRLGFRDAVLIIRDQVQKKFAGFVL